MTALVIMCVLTQGPALTQDSPASAYARALADLEKVPKAAQYYTRYLALYPIPPTERQDFAKALGFWMNSLTYRHHPVTITLVDNDFLIRINIADMGWDRQSRADRFAELKAVGVEFTDAEASPDPWEAIAARDPFFRAAYSKLVNTVEARTATVAVPAPKPPEALREADGSIYYTATDIHGRTWKNADWNALTALIAQRNALPSEEGKRKESTESITQTFATASTYARGWIDPAIFARAATVSYSAKLVLRADWFLAQISADPPAGFYTDILMIPKKEADLYKSLLIDEKNVRLQALTVGGATKAGVSYVANNPRELELMRGPVGELWRTYDFDDRKVAEDHEGKRNPRRSFRGTVAHDGREIIWELPSGLHAYAVYNGTGERVAEVPPNIAQDRLNPIPESRVQNAWKCVSCHGPEKGVIPFKDVVTQQMNRARAGGGSGLATYSTDPALVAREKRIIEDYYNEHYLNRMTTMQTRYAGIIKLVNGLESTENSKTYVKFYERYRYGNVNREQAARELGVPIGQLDAMLRKSAEPDLLFLIDDEPITRAQFELGYPAAMLGATYPWE